MDAAGEVFTLHGMVLRMLCDQLGCHFDGVSSAARAAFRAGMLSGARRRKIIELDVTYHMVRHITAASSRNFVANLSADLQSMVPHAVEKQSHVQEPLLRALAPVFVPASEVSMGVVPNTHSVALCMRDYRGKETQLNIKSSKQFGKLRAAYCSKGPGQGFQAAKVSFVVKGRRVVDDDTADKLGLEDGDRIDVTIEEVGD
eukprot:TRINITY_DN17557_c0_g1_i1.p1 TRINITY_DN17557_c0_g1~~TRINITY_DN17557_c0_g1_i1.p1  ORF type:complete len:219 (-),score=40.39 TRINITY_DN17557_c0_g1_i1:80-682(-)